jgi:cytochrome P450
MMGFLVATAYAVMTCFLLLLVVMACFVLARGISFYFSALHKLPGPSKKTTNSFFLGVFPELRKSAFLEPHKRWWQEAGGADVKLLHFSLLLGRSFMLVLDKNIMRDILKSRPELRRYTKRFELLRSIVGDGLVTLQGQKWLRHRRILTPSFNTSLLKEALNSSVPPKVARVVHAWTKAAEGGREIEPKSHLSALTLDVVGDVSFGHNFHAVDVIERWSKGVVGPGLEDGFEDEFITNLTGSLRPSLFTFVCFSLDLMPLATAFNPRIYYSRKLLDKAVDQVIANARQQQGNKDKPRSLLQLMLDTQDPVTRQPLTYYEIQSEVKTFTVAGHETTAQWTYWVFFALASYPKEQELVYQDIIKYISSSSNEITLADTEKMEYMNAFLNEVLRLYSPIGLVIRTTTQQEEYAGYKIPPRTSMMIPFHLLHRHPKYWDDPDSFKPGRWLHMSQEQAERQQGAFLPFSAGSRRCIGERLAEMEVHLVVAALVKAFRIELAPSLRNAKFTIFPGLSPRLSPQLKIAVKKR